MSGEAPAADTATTDRGVARRAARPAELAARVWPLLLVEAVVVVVAVARWTGQAPFGSDHDEYRMLADSLWSTGRPLIGGVEGTKYPFGWSLLLGAGDRVGLDITAFALAVNVVLVIGVVALVWLVTERWGALAATAAALVVALGSTLWSSVYAVMPDLALTFVAALTVWWLAAPSGSATPDTGSEAGRDRLTAVVWATLLAAAAVALKTFGIVIAGAVTLALLLRPATRRLAWVPAVVAGAIVVGQAWAVSRYPTHTTGYDATFWLRDPYDRAAGTIGAADLPARVWDRMDLVWTDIGTAVLGARMPDGVAIWLGLALVVGGAAAVRRWRWPALAMVAASTVILAAWPYRSGRFGLVFVPLAAAALAWLIARAKQTGGVAAAAALAAVAVGGYAWFNVPQLLDDAAAEERQYSELNASAAELTEWIDANVPADEPMASLAYREIAYRTDRMVLPMPYTSDTDELLAVSAGRGAHWFVVVRGLYGRREARADELLTEHPARFELAYHNARFDVYRVLPGRQPS